MQTTALRDSRLDREPWHSFSVLVSFTTPPWRAQPGLRCWLAPTAEEKARLVAGRVPAHLIWTPAELEGLAPRVPLHSPDVSRALGVEVTSPASLRAALEAFGATEIRVHPIPLLRDPSRYTAPEAILAVLQRGPADTTEFHRTLGRRRPGEVRQALAQLLASGRIATQRWRTGGRPRSMYALPEDFA